MIQLRLPFTAKDKAEMLYNQMVSEGWEPCVRFGRRSFINWIENHIRDGNGYKIGWFQSDTGGHLSLNKGRRR